MLLSTGVLLWASLMIIAPNPQDVELDNNEPLRLEETPRWDLNPDDSSDDLFAFENVIYRQIDRGGNPFVDEDASIYEGIMLLRMEVATHHTAHLRFLLDSISAASYDEVRDLAEVTGATGTNLGRAAAEGGWDHEYGNWTMGLNASFSNEYAYRSWGVGTHLSRSFLEDNTVFSLKFQGYRDLVRMIRFTGIAEPDEKRDSITTEFGWTQILTPESLMNITASHTHQRGFLATSFNAVLVDGLKDFEKAPGTRNRESLTTRYKHAVSDEDAIEASYRIYSDDWGITAHTFDLTYFLYLWDRSVLVEPNYRFHVQGEADFYAKTFDESLDEQTSDSDLGRFSGNLFGLNFTFIDVSTLGIKVDYDLGVNYYHRSDGLDLYWATAGLSIPF